MYALLTWYGGLTQEQYDTVQRRLGPLPVTDERRLCVDGPMEDGWQSFELWSSQPAYQQYLAAVREALTELGYPLRLGSWSWPVHRILPALNPVQES
ncbi:MAG: hypothetical protein K6U14_08420 [Firmicutes bacterium]|nr:hypothetical protein [Alicyclobacillaceae bacterium]MCL6497633.1 hypothetical protein [Bacillota bacterium]